MKLKNKLLAALTALSLAATCVAPIAAFADDEEALNNTATVTSTEVDDGSIDTDWYDSSLNEYTISTPAQLRGLAQLVNNDITVLTNQDSPGIFFGKTINIGDDITINGKTADWPSIGYIYYNTDSSVRAFTGTFNGNGNTIKLDNVTNGLFGVIAQATVKALTLNVNINNSDGVSVGPEGNGVAGLAVCAIYTVNISEVTVEGTITAAYIDEGASTSTSSDNGYADAAGFINRAGKGQTSVITIEDCTNEANVTGGDRKAAGFIISMNAGTTVKINRCYNMGKIEAGQKETSSSEIYAGGFTAWNSGVLEITDSYNFGSIEATRTIDGSSTVAAGGISGVAWGSSSSTCKATFNNVHNYGTVTAINDAYNDTQKGHNAHVGGLIGLANPYADVTLTGVVSDAAITGKITNESNTNHYVNAGGLIGQMNNSTVDIVSATIGEGCTIIAENVNTADNANNIGVCVGNQTGSASLTKTSVTNNSSIEPKGNGDDGSDDSDDNENSETITTLDAEASEVDLLELEGENDEEEVVLLEETEDDSEDDNTEAEISGTAVTGTQALTTGTYYLQDTIESGKLTISAENNVTLDLNGKSITYSGTGATISNAGTLTIIDSVGGGQVINKGQVYGAVYNTGTLTVEGGTFDSSGVVTAAIYNSGGDVTINGGEFSSSGANTGVIYSTNSNTITNTITINNGTITTEKKKYGIYLNSGVQTVYINGGKIYGTYAGIYGSTNSTVYINDGTISGGSIGIDIVSGLAYCTITGGEISSAATSSSTSYVAIFFSGGTVATQSKLIISGGNIAANSTYAIYVDGNISVVVSEDAGITSGSSAIYESCGGVTNGITSYTDVEIQGGALSGGIYMFNSDYNSLKITGGTFNGDVTIPKGADAKISGGQFTNDISAFVITNYYQNPTSLEVSRSSTQIKDNDTATLDENDTTTIDLDKGGTVAVTLTNLYEKIIEASNDSSNTFTYDQTEAATIAVVLDKENVTAFPETTGSPELGADYFAVDISVVKTDSSGNKETVPVTNVAVSVDLPVEPDSSGVTVYHVTDSNSVETIGSSTTANSGVTLNGTEVTFTAPSFSTYYFEYTPKSSLTESEIATNVSLELTEATTGVPGEYKIYLKGDSDLYINRFMAAELAFELDDSYDIKNIGAVSIEPADYINVISSGDGEYEFNVQDSAGSVSDITGKSILLGTLTISGEGSFYLTLKAKNDLDTNTDNQVQTAEYSNNIVNTFIADTGEATGNLYYDTPLVTDTITITPTTITINVAFPNKVDEQSDAYTDMKVTVTGLNTDKTVTFGNNNMTQGDITIGSDTYTGYSTTVSVTQGYSYSLTFEGAGYRTYRTSIVPTSGTATVTVWNNAMDSQTAVTTNDDNPTTAQVTFLAGDIVNQGIIDLYDLSAVVSYFGKTDLVDDTSTYETYTKYDLNRDGKIDSKDIAMVLVSWGF